MGSERPDEFETIARLLKPLAGHPAARSLGDDVAVVEPPAGRTLVITHDTIVAGVHFLPDDPPDLIARKLLRVNLSDLAAKGAEPFGYLMSCAWPTSCDWPWREAFARGLALDQTEYGLELLGGDTVSTPGPLTLGATLIGWGDPGRTPGRGGAKAGDLIFVSGTIGDGGLGLAAATGRPGLSGADVDWLSERYRLPQPRLSLAAMISREATASADVSDGLIADLDNIARESGLQAEIELDHVPLSAAAARWLQVQDDETEARSRLVTSGDDYEIIFTAPPERAGAVVEQAAHARCPVTAIGKMRAGEGVHIGFRDTPVVLNETGWRHR